mmetsp:Transcript_116393/g.362544  ORF Transcript_116393/g.362544 Transcript_116393/m.362544 type:complete len:270 (+) Transcript_116393:46-855(+)
MAEAPDFDQDGCHRHVRPSSSWCGGAQKPTSSWESGNPQRHSMRPHTEPHGDSGHSGSSAGDGRHPHHTEPHARSEDHVVFGLASQPQDCWRDAGISTGSPASSRSWADGPDPGAPAVADVAAAMHRPPPSPPATRLRPAALSPREAAGSVPSRGSKNHFSGQCRPCLAYALGDGCRHESCCNFCHHPHPLSETIEALLYSIKARLVRLSKELTSPLDKPASGGTVLGEATLPQTPMTVPGSGKVNHPSFVNSPAWVMQNYGVVACISL